MPDSCFGCCSTRSGINYICVFNAFWITLMLMVHFIHRLSDFSLFYEINSVEINSSHASSQERNPHGNQQSLHFNYTTEDFNQPYKTIPIMNIFMDYILIVRSGWCAMEFYLNVALKHSTHTASLKSIYSWLVIYYFNLGQTIIYQFITFTKSTVWAVFLGFFNILIVGVEVYIVQAYYDQQKLYAISSLIQFKWKNLPKTNAQTDKILTKSTTAEYNRIQPDEFGHIPIFVKNLCEVQNLTTT